MCCFDKIWWCLTQRDLSDAAACALIEHLEYFTGQIPMRAVTFLRQPWLRQALVAEALRELLLAWWLVRHRPFRAFADRLGTPVAGELLEVAQLPDPRYLADVRWAVSAINRTFGGRFTCLMQGMAAKSMLTRRNVPNTLVLGARISRDRKDAATDAMAAHAWLRVGPVVVLGGEARAEFVPVTSYHTAIGDPR